MSEMPKFVDFSKRDITLPDGFKDLHELLGEASMRFPERACGEQRRGVRCWCITVEAASEIPKFVARAFQSKAHSFVLMIVTRDQHLSLSIARSGNEERRAHVNVSRESQREEFVGRFLRQRLPAANVYSIQGLSHIHYPIPLLPDAKEFANFAMDLFGAFDGVRPESELEFRYDELT